MINHIETDIRGWDAIIDHRTGTAGDHETAEWLADNIRKTGAKPIFDTFPFTCRVLRECAIIVGDKRAEGIPLFDGGYTSAEGLSATLTALSDTVDSAIEESIAVTSFSSLGNDEATQQMHAARKGGYQAIVACSEAEDIVPGLALLNAPRYQQPYGRPVLQVGTQHREWLLAAAAERASAHFVAHVENEQTTVSNVQTRISGRNASLAPLVIMTPRSAWWTCTAERGGGIALWLACIRHFVREGCERDVIFTANTGHELGHLGLGHYLAQQPQLLKGAHAWIHFGANFAAVDCNIQYQASANLMQLGLAALAAENIKPTTITSSDTRPLGEACSIYDGGGCYLSLLGDNRWFHHPDDRWPTTIDLERTEKLARTILTVASKLASN